MSQDLNLPPVVSSDVVTGITDFLPRGRTNTGCTISMSYFNHLGYSISVLDSNNISTTIPTSSSPTGEPVFIVEYRIGFTSDVNLNWDTVLNENTKNPTIQALKAIVKDNKVKVSTIGNEYIIEYTIRHTTLSKNNFAIYYSDLNIVIAKSDKIYNVVHPLSNVGQNLVIALEENSSGFQYRVIINDPFNQFGERYVNINGSVFKVKRTVDHSVRPGVYVHSRDQCIDGSAYATGYGNDYYSFDEADESIPLYGTVHLAATLGDMNYKQTQDLKAKENEVKQKLADLSLMKVEMETKLKNMEYDHKKEQMRLERENINLKDQLEREKQLREEEASRSKHEYEKQAREDKAYYERRTYERKDTNELLKWIPAILSGVLTVATILMKLATTAAVK